MKIAAGEFPDDEGVYNDIAGAKLLLQACIPGTQVVDPNRRIHEEHAHVLRDRRRAMGRNCFSEPPRSARRFALSSAMRASNPILTREVFSFTPVSCEALAKARSSMFSVVLMHINMH
jgi:hypothetical protein